MFVLLKVRSASMISAKKLLCRGLAVCLLLLLSLYAVQRVFQYQQQYNLSPRFRSSTQEFLLKKPAQSKLAHTPSKNLPAYFNLVDAETALTNQEGGTDGTNCTLMKTRPAYRLCVHPRHKDKFISGSVLSKGVYEPHIIKPLQRALRIHPKSTFIDIGANIGLFSLLAASMGHKVIAVEPAPQNVKKLIQSIQVNGFADKIHVLNNAVTKSHINVSLLVNSFNQGNTEVLEDKNPDHQTIQTIVLDDLLHLIDTPTAIIKMDIEGYECQAMATSSELFHSVYVPYMEMEWRYMYLKRKKVASGCPAPHMQQMTDNLVHLGYHPHNARTGVELKPQGSPDWNVNDVYWRHVDQPRL
ncbi:uncharacterized protein LOC143284246 [Babylonia areolata]|uniref:uncharacterized protein LOC143284246 n=1 Tax=Babylonia areolata TaxID=304850 RepID=UPI003FD4B776